MGIIKRMLSGMSKNKAEFKEKFKQAQEEDKIMNLIEERKKSSNRRDLERYYREEEEDQVKKTLNKIHDKSNKENWKSKNMILTKGASILKNDKPILKEKNIFMDKKTNIPFTKGGENMFFKF